MGADAGANAEQRRVCSPTRARRATASAAAWPMAACVCQKYCPRRILKASSLGSWAPSCSNHRTAVGEDMEES